MVGDMMAAIATSADISDFIDFGLLQILQAQTRQASNAGFGKAGLHGF
jgi:hypothetical protein